MKRPRLGLRDRFVAATLVMVTVTGLGLGIAVYAAIERLEVELLQDTLWREMNAFVADFRRDPEQWSVHLRGVSRYAVTEERLDALPPELRPLPPGDSSEVGMGDSYYDVARRDVSGYRLYVALDITLVERLEHQLIWLLWGVLAVGYLLATALSFAAARLALRPVSELARWVASLEPERRSVSLHEQFGAGEVGIIAEAFDRYLARLDEFISREQAFTEDASHELRTPLAIILSATHLLREQPRLAPLLRERVMRIERAGRQMETMIESLLWLARENVEADAACTLAEVLADTVDIEGDAARIKGVTVELTVNDGVVVCAPRGMVAAVIANLLRNAITYTDRGRVEVRLDAARLTIRDTGVGLPPGTAARIFDRHFRGARSDGWGIGLHIVRRVCDRFGWSIEVAGNRAGGTSLSVSFERSIVSAT